MALLIGNQQYESDWISNLSNPENDVMELTRLLQSPDLNFKVFSLVNLRFKEMMDVLEIFCGMLSVPGVYALFYYSGHGFSYSNRTYLMPVDATLPLRCDHNIVSDMISARMQNQLSRAFTFLDCCRVKYVSRCQLTH